VFNIAMIPDTTLYIDLCKLYRKYDDSAAGTFFEVSDAKSEW
jgi:hypothetical protein